MLLSRRIRKLGDDEAHTRKLINRCQSADPYVDHYVDGIRV